MQWIRIRNAASKYLSNQASLLGLAVISKLDWDCSRISFSEVWLDERVFTRVRA